MELAKPEARSRFVSMEQPQSYTQYATFPKADSAFDRRQEPVAEPKTMEEAREEC